MKSHEISYEPGTRHVRLRLHGLWDSAALANFEHDVGMLVARTAHLPPGGQLLIDLRDFALQTLQIAEAIRPMIPQFAARVDRAAILAEGPVLQKLRHRRIVAIPNLRFFGSEQEAQDWLVADVNAG